MTPTPQVPAYSWLFSTLISSQFQQFILKSSRFHHKRMWDVTPPLLLRSVLVHIPVGAPSWMMVCRCPDQDSRSHTPSGWRRLDFNGLMEKPSSKCPIRQHRNLKHGHMENWFGSEDPSTPRGYGDLLFSGVAAWHSWFHVSGSCCGRQPEDSLLCHFTEKAAAALKEHQPQPEWSTFTGDF